MAAVAAAVSLLHSHTYTGLHHNFAMAMSCTRASSPPKRIAKLGRGGRFAPVPSSVRPCSSSSSGSGGDSKLSTTTTVCNSSMSFNNNGGSTADAFSDNDEDYVDCSIMEAVEVKSGPEGFLIKMRDGCYVKCVHNKVEEGGRLPDYAPQPAIVLQMNDGSNLLLPIIVLELPSTMLLEAVRNVQVARPTVYQVMRDMLELMGYKATRVRVTRRVHEAYYARVYLVKRKEGGGGEGEGDEDEAQAQEPVSLDLRPSDAINLAVRCKIPIQVNKELAIGDGVRIVKNEPEKSLSSRSLRSTVAASILTDFDKPETGACEEAMEFDLVRSMFIAAVEERYIDAAKLRDELVQLRSKNRKQTQT
ncbi:unnamed protein product [Sphagnum compactum]